MPKPYSYDLRQKVIEAIELNGMKRCEASEHFNISRNTINLWLQRKAKTGDFRAKVREHRSRNNKILDWEKFRAFAETHGDKTQVEMAQLWDGEISDSEALLRSADRTISRALEKIGFTRKKRPTATVKGMNNYAKPLSKSYPPLRMNRLFMPMNQVWTIETTMAMATVFEESAFMT